MMDQMPSSSARKRAGPLPEESNGSSPFSSVKVPSPVKRRKLSLGGSSPSTPKALNVLKNVIGGVFGLGSRKESSATRGTLEREENTAEASSEIESSGGMLRKRSGPIGANDNKSPSRRAKSQFGRDYLVRSNPETPTPKRKRGSPKNTSTIDGESTEDELNATVGSRPIQVQLPEAESAAMETLAKRKLKRPKKPLLTRAPQHGDTVGSQAGSLEECSAVGGFSRSSGRARRRPRRYSDEAAVAMRSELRSILTPGKKGQERPKKSVAIRGTGSIQKSSGHDRVEGTSPILEPKIGKPKKDRTSEIARIAAESHGYEGTGNEAGAVEEQSPKPQKAMPKKLQAMGKLKRPKKRRGRGSKMNTALSLSGEPIESDNDDTVCGICGGGDSIEPNEILLCDTCDNAFHQECYNIPFIPEGDWLCRNCRPDDTVEPLERDAGAKPSLEAGTANAPPIKNFDRNLRVMQKLLLDKLTGRKALRLRGLDDEYQKVRQVVEQTVLAGEGNSMLVMGARGCGKTALVEKVITDLLEYHREKFHVVRLNGFIHTDDKLALRDIWRQLGKEMEVEDEITHKVGNYADTLASLLALLSHPSEISEVEANQTANSVIFILDEFDLFTSHPRQTLLYNLFEIAQARKAPVAVLGLTTRIDVVESLEKRVKSRFSHRYVHLSLARSLPTYLEICKQGLLIDPEELIRKGTDFGVDGYEDFLSFWESMVETLFHKDPIFKDLLQMHYYRSKSVSSFLTSCILPIANLTPGSMPLGGNAFISKSISLSPPDSKLHLLQSLSDLDIALLIAAARLDIILDTDTCNFAMAYDEYSNLTSKHRIQTSSTGVAALGAGAKVWGREVAMGSWEHLIDCELLVPAGVGSTGASGRDIGREGKMWKVDVGLEEIPGSVQGLSGIMAKWCREI